MQQEKVLNEPNHRQNVVNNAKKWHNERLFKTMTLSSSSPPPPPATSNPTDGTVLPGVSSSPANTPRIEKKTLYHV